MANEADTPTPDYLTGQFLIAETELQDPNFFRTVVLLIQHNADGAFGLVINRESEVTVGDVIDETETSPIASLPVFVGGPVQQNYVFSLHSGIPSRYRSEYCEEVSAGVFFEPSFQHVLDYARSEDYRDPPDGAVPTIRVFAGYSGWGTGQLEHELEQDAWFIHPAQAEIVFDEDAHNGWKAALSKKGSFYRIVAETGYNPSMN
ncbi:MAG: YqgE/AlgH family protein [Spirochaeta sp.]|jgi:putative transcriptional regulator|nr:YqgE/AlgH family protein [Spirochaeta sp.]